MTAIVVPIVVGVALLVGGVATWKYCQAKKATEANSSSVVGEENADVIASLYKKEEQTATYGTPINEGGIE